MKQSIHQTEEDINVLVQFFQRMEANYATFFCDVKYSFAFVLMSQLQLALRHPGNKGGAAEQTRQFVEEMIAQLEREDSRIGPIMRKGFDPAHDVKW